VTEDISWKIIVALGAAIVAIAGAAWAEIRSMRREHLEDLREQIRTERDSEIPRSTRGPARKAPKR
jgi:hypothetical protein